MSDFKDKVIAFVKSVPKGKVVSYGQVAANSGSPRASRQVGGILRALGTTDNLPWWRVINNKGLISIKGNWEATKELQKQLLEKDGLVVGDSYVVDIKKYRYKLK